METPSFKLRTYYSTNDESNRRQWNFHVMAPEIQIDVDSIYTDLTPEFPIALVELDGEKSWVGLVLIHESIIKKAEVIYPNTNNFEYFIEVDSPEEFDDWTRWVTKVKKARWPEEVKNAGKVKVTLKKV